MDTQAVAAAGVAGSGTRLPHYDVIQRAFGLHQLGDVRAHIGGPAAEAATTIGAEAYATGSSVAFRSQPSLHLAAHEAAHVVQQRAGVQLSGGVGREGDEYERQADAVADAVVQGRSAEALLGTPLNGNQSGGVQRKELSYDECSAVMFAAARILGRSDSAAGLIDRAPAEYRQALRQLHRVVQSLHSEDRGSIAGIYDRYKQASAALRPAYDRGRQLMTSYYVEHVAIPDQQLRTFLVRETAVDRATNADLTGEKIVADDASIKVRAAYLKVQGTKVRHVVQKLSTSTYRMTASQAPKAPDIATPFGWLMTGHSIIVTANALLDATDEQFLERWAKAKAEFLAMDPSFESVDTLIQFVHKWTTVVGGFACTTASLVSSLAAYHGHAELAAQLSGAAKLGIRTLGQVGAAVQLVHSGLVLLDDSSTTKEREDAIGNGLVSASFLTASFVGGGVAAGPVFLAALATWELVKFIAVNYLKSKFAIVNGVLAPVFGSMKSRGDLLAVQLKRIGNAGVLASMETDPELQLAYRELVRDGTESLRESCIRFLQDCQPTNAITDKGKWRIEPGGYKVFQQAFAPHMSRKFGNKPEEVAEAAAELVDTISWVLSNAESLSWAEAAGTDMPKREGAPDLTAPEKRWQDGDTVSAEWKGKQYPATVIAVSDDGAQAQLHWHGYKDEWHSLWVDCLTLRPAPARGGTRGAWQEGDQVTISDWDGSRQPGVIIEVGEAGKNARAHWIGQDRSNHRMWIDNWRLEPRD